MLLTCRERIEVALNEYQAIISVMALFKHLQMTASRFDIAHEKITVQQKLILKKK